MPPERNAIGKHAHDLSKHLARRGHRVTVVHRDSVNSVYEVDGIRHVGYRFIPSYPIHAVVNASLGREWIVREIRDCDVVHYHSPLIVPFKSDTRLIATSHVRVSDLIESEEPSSVRAYGERLLKPALVWQERMLFKRSSHVIALNRRIEDSIKAEIAGARTSVIPHGIDTGRMACIVPSLESNRIVFVGQLIERKDVGCLIKAFRLHLRSHPDSRLVIIGEGQQKRSLVSMAHSLGLGGLVEFLGYVTEERLMSELADSAFFVLPSLEEGVSSSLLEAMAAGLVCLASGIPANKEVVDSLVNGVLFEPGNPQSLAHCLDLCSSDRELMNRLSASGRTTATARFDWKLVASRIEDVYLQETSST